MAEVEAKPIQMTPHPFSENAEMQRRLDQLRARSGDAQKPVDGCC